MNVRLDDGPVFVFQPALPNYRLQFFEALSRRLGTRFSVYFSEDADFAGLSPSSNPNWGRRLPPIQNLPLGLSWQPGIAQLPLTRCSTIVLSGMPRNITMLFMLMKAKRMGCKVVWWGHLWSGTSTGFRAAIRRWIMSFSDKIIFYTDREREIYVSQYPYRGQTVFALNNGVDLEPILLRRKVYIPEARSSDILFLGRLTKKARIEVLLEALTQPGLESLSVEVIGDGAERGALEQLSHSLRVQHRIRWHGTLSCEDDIATVANRCRIFVYPGSVGLSLLHAFSYGLPAIIHSERKKHMPEHAAFCDNYNGVAFERDSPKSLADAILRITRNSETLRELSRGASSTTVETFNTEDMVRRFLLAIE
jgi:glycosyltransferase involved in cell wall biosynthesis